jgi:putative DNA primase/helicase
VAQDQDFPAVAAAALAMAPTLLAQWLGGRRQGHEWVGETRANGGLGDSWSVNLDTGAFGHFGGPEKGGDLIALFAALNHISQTAACAEVARLIGMNGSARVIERSRPQVPSEPLPEPIPDNAPPLRPHPQHGEPQAIYRYDDKFWVARYRTSDGGKFFRPFTWRAGEWVMKGYPEPRPLYRAHDLRCRPEEQVLVVEGEKCADAAATVMRQVVVCWANGANSVKKNSWSELAGRDVILWPDADQAGREAMATLGAILHPIAKRVRIVEPNGQTDGWDVADAIAEGWDRARIASWVTEHIKTIQAPSAPASPAQELLAPGDPESDYPAGSAPRSALALWQQIGLAVDAKQVPHVTIANASTILQTHEAFAGKIWWDSFRERIYHTLRGAPAPWTDVDSMRAAVFIQQQLRLPKFNLALIHDAVAHAAHQNARNSVIEWLDSLSWDGIGRADHWVSDCLGVALTPYAMAVASNWLLSMVARAFVPGCQVDHMPVLEGKQGKGKSSALEILGGEWYAAVGIAFGDKEFLQTIQGKWLIEIPDMAGFGKREHSQVIATITTRGDRYRASYGRYAEDHPRKCVFAATSETDDYLPDMRGHRRYWPLRCGEIDLDALRAQREQLFAEAVHAYRAGATWYEMPHEETGAEQRERAADDLWTDAVLAYLEPRELAGHPVYPPHILRDGLEMKAAQMDASAKYRVIAILRAAGWIRKTVENRRQWVKPRRVDPL